MATPKLKNIVIQYPKVHPANITDRKYWTIETIFQYKFFATNKEGRDALIDTVKDRAIGEERLMSRYLDKIESLKFISKDRIDANPEFYWDIEDQQVELEDGRKGYMIQESHANYIHFNILLSKLGIESLLQDNHIKNDYEAKIIHSFHDKYFNRFDNTPEKANTEGQTRQTYLTELTKEIVQHMEGLGLSKTRSKLLTRAFKDTMLKLLGHN